MANNNTKHSRAILRVLSFLPALNWIALLLLGTENSSSVTTVCAAFYGIFTFLYSGNPEYPSLSEASSLLIYFVVIIHYSIYSSVLKKRFSSKNTKEVNLANNIVKQPKTNQADRANKTSPAQTSFIDVDIPGNKEQSLTIPMGTTSQNPSHSNKSSRALETRLNPVIHEAPKLINVHNSSDSKFFADMKKYVDVDAPKARFVHFMSYWPTYDDMDSAQRAWYFYWRQEVRNKRYPDTDLSYIFLYTYELLSGYGWKTPQEGLDELLTLWKQYHDKFPRLNSYLSDWSFDFAKTHKLEYQIPDKSDCFFPRQPAKVNLFIDWHREDKPLKLPFALIDVLCDHSLTKSKFYKDAHHSLMQETIPRVVELADNSLRKNREGGILQVYGPESATNQSLILFSSARCPNADSKITFISKDYMSSERLQIYFKQLVRYSENVLRDLYDYRDRLPRVNFSDHEIAKAIRLFLEKEYAPIQHIATQQKSPRLSADIQPLVSKAKTRVPSVAKASSSQYKEPQRGNHPQQPLRTPLKLNFDNISELRKQSDAVRDALETIDEIQAPQVTMPEMPIHEETANLSNSSSREPIANAKETSTSNSMQGTVDNLSAFQIEVLRMIVSQDATLGELYKIADEHMTMPELLIDDINNVAMEHLGDILIDSQDDELCILEEHKEELERLLT